MKKSIKIITDGSCDFPKEILDRVNPGVVGINVCFGEESYIGGVEIDDKTFYEKMRGCKELPKTSSPSPDRFMEVFDCEEDEILVITLTSKLSSTYSNAVLAKNMYLEENPEKRIEIVDSETGSICTASLILRCHQLAQQGKSMDEILESIEKLKKEMIFFGTLNTLENAIKGGRVNALAGKLINALNFKVIIRIDEGIVKPIDKARGESNSLKKLFEYVRNNVTDANNKIVTIAHSNSLEKALKIKDYVEQHYKFEEILIASIGPIMGTFTSEGAILVSVL
ncbi:DegV family protein [Romboutsia maritimum]|uniref:DegV family protein n=1 Tax=Romboutsia maritimum TaxID=2020948 RepID=A0A371IVC8_9FIRM|nr:DegV family protein [Romboutsia maritimum]RDY24426.1 DegV family protein [Romboutsia maritimum]